MALKRTDVNGNRLSSERVTRIAKIIQAMASRGIGIKKLISVSSYKTTFSKTAKVSKL